MGGWSVACVLLALAFYPLSGPTALSDRERYAILSGLARRPGIGGKELVQRSRGELRYPGVYRLLARLEDEGLVESWREPDGIGRRCYRLTERGYSALAALS